MKITDGEWLLQPGVTPFHAVEAHDVVAERNALLIHAPTRPIRDRGDTLNGALLTARISAPMAGVVGVRLAHFTGGVERAPEIPLQPVEAPPVIIDNNPLEAVLRSGDLSVHVKKPGWEITFRGGGRTLTKTGLKGMGYVQYAGKGDFMVERLHLGVGECVYGLGERFTAFVKNGQVVENENKDGGTGSDQAYKCVPFYLTNRGYGVLVNHTGPVSFEVASERTARVQFSRPGQTLEYFVIYGPTPADILRRLTALTGRPALPPAWSFGLWLTTSFTTNYDEATCTDLIDGMASRDLPLHVFHFDCFWMREFDWCSFEWDPRVFPDPAGMLRRFHDRGLKVCVWINPYIAQRSPLFEEGRSRGYFIRKADGGVWQTDLWQPGMAIVDFTNPAARDWFTSHLKRLLDMGVDCFKTDFGERIPVDNVVYHDGSDPAGMHNHYPILYNECVFKLLEQTRGQGDAALFARSTYASGQRFPVHWGGDCWSTFEAMAESLRGGLSLALCGFGFWSHDIGGFEGQGPASVYKRWVAFGLLSSHSRLHGSSSYRVPWNYDDEACDVVRQFTKLKCRLMPYLYGLAVTAHREGIPVLRPMMLEFDGDPACDTLERQYMLGDALLVAPVFTEDGAVDYYLPDGRWTHLLSGEVRAGGRWHRSVHDYLSLPLFVRPGTVLPIGSIDDRPDYDFAAAPTVRIYELGDGATARRAIPTTAGGHGATVTAQRRGSTIDIHVEGTLRDWRIQLVGVPRIESVKGGKASDAPQGIVITPRSGTDRLEVVLETESSR